MQTDDTKYNIFLYTVWMLYLKKSYQLWLMIFNKWLTICNLYYKNSEMIFFPIIYYKKVVLK